MEALVCRTGLLIPLREGNTRLQRTNCVKVTANKDSLQCVVPSRRRVMYTALVAVPLLLASPAFAADWGEARRRREIRKKELRRASKEAATSGEDVAMGMESDYSLPDDHSPNTHGRKSRTVPGKRGTEYA